MLLHRPIRVLIVDDHAGSRAGLMTLVESENPRLCAVGAAATASEAMAQAREHQPDVIVLDVNLAGEDGLALMPALHRATRCEVIVLTSLADPSVAAQARRLGARACLHKTAPAAELMAIILSVRPEGERQIEGIPANAGVGLSHALGEQAPMGNGQ